MNKKIKWGKMTDLPEFDTDIENQHDENRSHNMFEFEMPVDDYLRFQEKHRPGLLEKKEYRKEYTKHFDKPDLEFNPEGIPTPVLEFDEFGNKTTWQEGYRRGLYAQDQGEKTIPVWMAYKNRPGFNKTLDRKQSDILEDEY